MEVCYVVNGEPEVDAAIVRCIEAENIDGCTKIVVNFESSEKIISSRCER